MAHGLWVVNSGLLLIFSAALFTHSFLQQNPPEIKIKKIIATQKPKQPEKPADQQSEKLWEKIYQCDIFGTFIAQPETPVKKQELITPIPEPKAVVVTPPPPLPKIDFIAPLTLTLKGLVVSTDETKSIAMIADEANKERIYHLGEKIKDAQIAKIAHNRVVLIRANGQHDTIYLRKDKIPATAEERWKTIVKKVNDQSYNIEPSAFKTEVESLGQFLEGIAIIGTAYNNGSPVGMRIGKLEATDIGSMIGLVENDIIVSVNGIKTANPLERMKIYDTITQMKIGESFNVMLNRAGKNVAITYTLARVEPPSKIPGILEKTSTKKTDQDLRMNPMQEREKIIRDFEKIHAPQKNQETVMEIRKRLLENFLHTRPQNSRVS